MKTLFKWRCSWGCDSFSENSRTRWAMHTPKKLNFRSQWLLNTIFQASPQQFEKPVIYPDKLNQRTLARADYWLQLYSSNDATQSVTQVTKTLRASVFLIVILAFLAGIVATSGALSTELKTVNLPLFLVGSLGAHFLALLFWIVVSFSRGANGNVVAYVLFNAGARMGRWLYGREQPLYDCAFESLITLATRHQLLKPFFGLLSHLFWLFYLLGTFLTAGLLFVFAEYHFVWETTVLSSGQLAHVHALLNASLLWFNVTLPPLTALSSSGDTMNTAINAATGLWLLFFIAYYGVFVRIVGVAGCFAWLKWRSQGTSWEEGSASYLHFKRYQDPISAQVLDKDQAIERTEQFPAKIQGQGVVMVWLEEKVHAEMTSGYRDLGIVSVSRDLDELLERENGPWQQLLIVINSKNSPDRANLGVLRRALDCAEYVKVFFVETAQPNFRESWLTCISGATPLKAIEVCEHA
ncbi:MAG: membrane protein of unknown function DUF2868 [Idiomarinaceae bacterium HL-53]|nr:MAG: membrane protein of unknown function DUF2868 [Idiomarinaceae bacterium HL-53]CUS49041.1 Protein of unknown function (DUF2868) [Idiomarinaceae bacterium HL-53]